MRLEVIKNRILKGIAWTTLGILLLFISATVFLRIPSIQTRVVQQLSTDLSTKTGFEFNIGQINLNWFDVLVIEDLEVKDLQDSTMIDASKLTINFGISDFLKRGDRKFDDVLLEETEVSLYKHNLEEPINITKFIDTLKYYLSTGRRSLFSINEINLKQSRVNLRNLTASESYPGFDMNNFTIKELEGTLSKFNIRSDTVSFLTENLAGIETKTNLPIHYLNSDFTVHQKALAFRNLETKIGSSIIRDSIVFRYARMSHLNNFIDSVQMQLRLDNSVIYTKDLKYFSKEFREIDDVFQLSGYYIGNAPDFRVRNLDLELMDGSKMRGSLSFTGLPNLEETFIGIRLNNSNLNRVTLEKYLGEEVLKRLPGINSINFTGNFTGFINDFVAYGDFDTNLGKLDSDLNIKILENSSYYQGRLKTEAFDIGTYSGLEVLNLIDMEGEIQGSGFTIADADFVLDGRIYRIDVNNYPLTNVNTNARFASEFFQGELGIDDPNFRLTANGEIDLRKEAQRVNIGVDVDTLVLNKLNLTSRETSIQGKIDLNGTGLTLDSIKGNLRLDDFTTIYEGNELFIDSLFLISNYDSIRRELQLETDRVSLHTAGNFDYTTLYSDIVQLVEEYKLNLENESEEISNYYSQKNTPLGTDYRLDFELDLRDINPLVKLFWPNVQFSQNIQADGNFTHGYTSILNFNSEFDSLQLGKELFLDNMIEMNASKIADSVNVLAAIFLESGTQQLSSRNSTQNLFGEAIWDRNEIDFNISIEESGLSSYLDLYGELIFLPDLTVIKLKPSDLQAINEKWVINEENAIMISGKEIAFSTLGVSKKAEFLMLDGSLSEDPTKELTLDVQNIELSNLNPLLSKEISGKSNGELRVRNYYEDIFFETNLVVTDFTINDFLIGDVKNLSLWNPEQERFDLAFEVSRDQKRLIDISGNYTPGGQQGLDLQAIFTDAELKVLEPFIEPVLMDFQGNATGTFTITGNLDQPKFQGTGVVTNGGLRVDFLNTYYTFEGDLLLQGNEIGLRNMLVQDRDGNEGRVSGGFFLDGFRSMSMDFFGEFENILALNTTLEDNDLFYGVGRGSGSITISGEAQDLTMEVNAVTNSGTRIFIPLGGSSEINKEDFIRFVSLSESEEQTEFEIQEFESDYTGLDFTLNISITPDAYGEIIFDQRVGDIIRGRGSGDLQFNLSKLGEFTMYGDYQFQEGGYNFTLYNIVNKEFDILPESRISWLGDPYGGTLDIDASYEQLASVAPLLDTAYRDALEIRRRYPTKVILDLTGPLLSPEISFDIAVEDLPNTVADDDGIINLDTEMSAIAAEWAANEQELQKQVFSLIVLRQFSEETFNTGGTVGSSVSEFVSNQLSYWISQVDENLEIDISLGSLDSEAYNTFQMRLSYTFLDGRLRVTRDGGFTDPESQASAASIIGDWSVEYMLTENGNLRVKLFQRTDFNNLNSSLSYGDAALQAGFSLIYTQSFDEVQELFKQARDAPPATPEETSDTDGVTGQLPQ